MTNLTIYEKTQLAEIESWKLEEPGVIVKSIGVALIPITWLVRALTPESAIIGILEGVNSLAKWLTDINDILRDGNVSSIRELRKKDLELCDKLANEAHNWGIGLAVAEGAATGIFGLPGMVADIPALITIALRTIHKIGACYGYESESDGDALMILGVLAASGANSVEEKVVATTTLRMIHVILTKQSWKKITETAAKNQLSKEATVIATKNLAKQLGINITKRKALAAIPVIGAAIGASANGWYAREVGWAARRCFQERWLMENHKITDPNL